MKFSMYMGLTTPQNGFGFFDLDISDDTLLFVDTYYLSKFTHDSNISLVNKTLKVFTDQLLNLVLCNQLQKAYQLCSHFQETKGTGLGYSNHKINGRGAGKTSSQLFVDSLFQSKAVTSNAVNHLEEFSVTCDGIGKDRLSDIVISVGKLGFIQYTQAQCRLHNIAMYKTKDKISYYDASLKKWVAQYFDLPHIVDPSSQLPQEIILIPEYLLNDKLVYDHHYFLNRVVIPHFKEDAIRKNLSKVQTYKNGKKYISNQDLLSYPFYQASNKKDVNNFIQNQPNSLELFRRVEAPLIFERLNKAS